MGFNIPWASVTRHAESFGTSAARGAWQLRDFAGTRKGKAFIGSGLGLGFGMGALGSMRARRRGLAGRSSGSNGVMGSSSGGTGMLPTQDLYG